MEQAPRKKKFSTCVRRGKKIREKIESALQRMLESFERDFEKKYHAVL